MSRSDEGQGFGHAKVILLGEHAVVYGYPALAGGLDVGFRARARRGEKPTLSVPAWGVTTGPGREEDLSRAFSALLEQAPDALRDAEVIVDPEVPSRAGLGSSAAMSVAIVRALTALALAPLDADGAARWAGLAEEVFHGKGRASGVDAAVAARGGLLRFSRGTPPETVIAPCDLDVVVAHIEPRAATSEMVARVHRAREAEPERVEGAFQRIGALVEEAIARTEEGDLVALGEVMNEDHQILRDLELSTPALEAACQMARGAGATGAKLTGAGGGGCIIALAPGCQAEVAKAIEPASRWVAAATLGSRR